MSNLSSLLENAIPVLQRTARALRRELEALADHHSATPGLSPQQRAYEFTKALDARQSQARGMLSGLAAEHGRAVSEGGIIPADYDARVKDVSAAVDRITSVRSLDDAYELADSLRVAA